MVKISRRIIDVDTLSGVENSPVFMNGILKAASDDNGAFTIDVAPGTYLLEIRPREFFPIKRKVIVTADGKLLDEATKRSLKQEMPMSRATL